MRHRGNEGAERKEEVHNLDMNDHMVCLKNFIYFRMEAGPNAGLEYDEAGELGLGNKCGHLEIVC